MDDFTEEMFQDDRIRGLSDFLALVKKGKPWSISTERLIRLNGNFKRGKQVNESINQALRLRGLVCTPTIENADFYGDVVVSDPRDELPSVEVAASLALSSFSRDGHKLVHCGPEMPVAKIKTIMVGAEISQIPVLSGGGKTIEGVVSWRSLAQPHANDEGMVARDVMVGAGQVASSRDDFMDLVDVILSQGFVLYTGPDGQVKGIVTASDLAEAFRGTAGLFVRLQEVETRMRILLDRSPVPSLQKCLAGRREEKTSFRGAIDMQFGEYLEALRVPDIWKATGIMLDQETCLKHFEQVRQVRNGVMHFSLEESGGSSADESDEDVVMRALRILRSVRVG